MSVPIRVSLLQNAAVSEQYQPDNPLSREEVEIVDQIYNKSYIHFLFCLRISLIENALKIITIPLFMPKTEDIFTKIWLIMFLVLSILQFCWSLFFLKRAQFVQKYYEIAKKIGHITISNQPFTEEYEQYRVSVEHYDFQNVIRVPQEDERRFKQVSNDIRQKFENQTQNLSIKSKILMVLHHCLHIWGYMFMFSTNELLQTYITILLLPGTFRHFQFYLIVTFYLIFAPIYFIWISIKSFMKTIIGRYKFYKIFKRLSGKKYEDTFELKGQHRCQICIQDYLPKQKVLILKCSQMHHFHETCMKDWATIRLNCPLCRKTLQ